MNQLKVGLVGAGNRIVNLYAPILKLLHSDYQIVGVTSRSYERAEETSRLLSTQAFKSVEDLVMKTSPDILIVSVNYHANDQYALESVATGTHCLLETPVSVTLDVADQLDQLSKKHGTKIEVAEQYYRRPIERIKQALLQNNVFGKISTAYNDFMGHDYHGFSIIRSYIGLQVQPIRIQGWTRSYDSIPYYSWISKKLEHNTESWQHAVVEFENQAMGFFTFTNHSYDSALRWQRGTRFFGERGMAVNGEMTLLSDDGKDPLRIQIEKRIHNVGGVETLDSIVAQVDGTYYDWINPFRNYYMDDEMIATADCLRSLKEAVLNHAEPEYGILQARQDQELTLAMYQSSTTGKPVELVKD